MRNSKRIVACILALGLLLSVGCSSTAPAVTTTQAPATTAAQGAVTTQAPATTEAAAPQHDPVEIEIYTSAAGSFTYVLGIAWAELINTNSSWVKATAIESQGPSVNELMMYSDASKRPNTVYTATAYNAYHGYGDFSDKQNTRSKLMFSFGLSANVLLTTDKTINTLQDMVDKNKLMLLRTPRTMTFNPYWEALFNGSVNGQMNYEYMDFTSSVEAMMANRAGAFIGAMQPLSGDMTSYAGNPATEELFSRASYFKFLDFPLEMDKVLQNEVGGPFESFPGSIVPVPAQSLHATQTEPVNVCMVPSYFFADEDMDPEIVYEITRIFGENASSLGDYHPQAAAITPDVMAIYTFPREYHPGAMRYLDEKGISPVHVNDFMAAVTK